MKRGLLLHAELSALVASLGHGDRLVIADAGLPVPRGTRCIDLAVGPGVPSAKAVLQAIASEMQVERVVLAEELRSRSPQVLELVQDHLPAVAVEWCSHDQFKLDCAAARAVVRTGEFTPYCNLMLVSGVVF